MKQNAERADLDIVEFNNMIDIMKELADIFGINDNNLNDLFKDGTIKVSHNGKPIIDIENGVDKLAPKNGSKEVCEKMSNKESNVSATTDKPYTCKSQSYTCPETTVTYNNTWLNKSLLMVNPEEFIIVDEVAGYPLSDSQTEITFSHKTPNGWVPGITDNQLLAILCERFKKDPKKVTILKALMNS